jgi:hypothetical protein
MSFHVWWPVLLNLALVSAMAAETSAPAAPVGQPDPLDARADVPPAPAPAALRRLRAGSAQAVEDWRQANDRVARIGGWRTYLREAQQPSPAGSAPAAAASSPAARPHDHGHR